MSSAVPAVYSGRLIAAPTVSRLTILRAADSRPYGITSAGRRGRRPLRSHECGTSRTPSPTEKQAVEGVGPYGLTTAGG